MTISAADLGVPRLAEIRARIMDRIAAAEQHVERSETALNHAMIARGIAQAELTAHDRAVEAMQLPEPAAASEPKRRNVQGAVVEALRVPADINTLVASVPGIERWQIAKTLGAMEAAGRARNNAGIWRLMPDAPGAPDA